MNYLAKFQQFVTKSELNAAVSSHLNYNESQLNETDRDVITMLSRYAVKYPGVTHLKLATIANAIKKSDRTIRRSVEKLEQLQVIKRQTFSREKSGGQGANLYIFLPFIEQTDTPAPSIEENIQTGQDIDGDQTYEQVSITHYTRFKNLMASHTGEDNADFASRLYGIYRAQTLRLMKFSIHQDKGELFEALSLQALHVLFQATKKKKVHNLFGYYDGIFRELIDKAIFGDAFMDYDEPVELRIPSD